MNRDVFRVKDDAKDVYSAISSSERNGEMSFCALAFPVQENREKFKVFECSKWKGSSCGQNEWIEAWLKMYGCLLCNW